MCSALNGLLVCYSSYMLPKSSFTCTATWRYAAGAAIVAQQHLIQEEYYRGESIASSYTRFSYRDGSYINFSKVMFKKKMYVVKSSIIFLFYHILNAYRATFRYIIYFLNMYIYYEYMVHEKLDMYIPT